eukprot:CAMPEP_0205946000 /NCGR_PEP_ID=MMETSP1325-20131115/67836_1 /ASSEMBLY_ACC=CAM_ASM_000708 /TAXON_ID=236786 /ORGANISM="Florenciella sp., Strain RCC1007" /LENGTH=60 /DNA_ID=CAMNT_0053317017 /DNA_START=1 /DNA_END=180 /DNA_ORIENTATION=+
MLLSTASGFSGARGLPTRGRSLFRIHQRRGAERWSHATMSMMTDASIEPGIAYAQCSKCK